MAEQKEKIKSEEKEKMNEEKKEPEVNQDPQVEENKEPTVEQNVPEKKKDINDVFFRGVIRAISQQLDEQNRIQNAMVLTTPPTVIEERRTSGVVTIYWGDNDRAKQKLEGLSVGDHVTVKAKLRTYFTEVDRGTFFYGVSVGVEHPDGITGLGEYEPDKNEGYFEGVVRSEYKANEYFVLLNMMTSERFEGRDMNNYPNFSIGGRLLNVYKQNKEKFEVGKRIGAACTIRQRVDKKTGKEVNDWTCFALMYEDENGNMKQLPVPPAMRRPARRRVRTIARSTAAADMARISRDQTTDEAEIVAEPSAPVENPEDVLETIE